MIFLIVTDKRMPASPVNRLFYSTFLVFSLLSLSRARLVVSNIETHKSCGELMKSGLLHFNLRRETNMAGFFF